MSRCLEIAKNGLGTTAPNPMVGCLIVHDGKIIAEGFTSAFGGAHAEANAINSVVNKKLLRKAILYVTLEPCSHYGKTPPCADLIVKHGIPKIVIGLSDPHEKVAGKGIAKLRESGCEVTVGVMEDECREHHKRFLTFHEKNRPYIILKWAETLDGFVAPEKTERKKKSEPFWITDTYSRQLVHKWRGEEQAILVGTNTVLEDNPQLNVREWTGKNPLRVILDRTLKINPDYHVLDGSIPTLVITNKQDASKQKEGVHYTFMDYSKNSAQEICKILHKNNITSILIEGGTQTLQTFIDSYLWDEARVFKGITSFEKGVKAPIFSGRLIASKNIVADNLKIFRND